MDVCQGEIFPQEPKKQKNTLLYFVWSPPWHLYIFLLENLLAFYLTYLLAFYLAFYLAYAGIFSCILSGISSGILSGIFSGILSGIAVGVRQCPLRPGSRGWGPAVPTAIWNSPLRSGSAHCDLEVAVEVRQCPLRPGSRGWGPAVPTAIRNSPLRSGSAHWDLEFAVGIWTARRRRRRTAIWKSRLGSGLRGGGSCKNLEKTKIIDPRRGSEEKLGRWHGVIFLFLFCHWFWNILGPRWQKPRENFKKNRPMETVWGKTGQAKMVCFFLFFHWFWTSRFSFKNWCYLYENFG